jgi:predicted transcriptional regulator
METFAKGADGVLVVGCHPPDCHFIRGNLLAERRIEILKELISLTGLEPVRLQLNWAFPTENEHFVKLIDDFRNRLRVLGPSPLARKRPDTNILINIKAAKMAAEDFRIRDLIGKEKNLTEKENRFKEKMSHEEFYALLREAIKVEFTRQKIRLLTKERPMSVSEIAALINMKTSLVLRHIVNMRRKGMITLDHVEKTTPIFKALEVR